MGEILFPFVRWAQDQRNVYLKVELQNVQNPDLQINAKKIQFEAVGDGAKGKNLYNFNLDLYGQLDEKECTYKVTDRYVQIVLRKFLPFENDEKLIDNDSWWPRLTSKSIKFSWLKIDFDRWYDPNESPDDEKEKDIFKDFDMEAYEREQAKEMVDRMMKEGGYDATEPLNLTKPYLITYNCALFVGFFLIIVELTIGYANEGQDYFPKVWPSVSRKLICCQIAQFLEIGHALLGYVRTSWATAFMQVCGRGFVLFVLLASEPRMHDKPFVFYLFYVWSLVEIVRYPYYALSTMKKEVALITWLRYTIWIVLYPLGFLLEGVIVLRAMPYFEETQKYSYPMPNNFNISIDFPFCLKIYLIFFLIPGMVFLMSHMRSQRLQKLGKKIKKKTK